MSSSIINGMHDIPLEKWHMHGPYGLSEEYWTPKRLREKVSTIRNYHQMVQRRGTALECTNV